MAVAWIPAAIAGAASLAGSLWSGQQSRSNTDKTIAANRRAADLAYQRDLEMWNKTNEYNSYVSQMGRLEKAGLNPNLVYGSGAGSSNASSSMPRYNAPTAQYDYKPLVDIPSAISTYQDIQMRQAQTDNLKEQNKVIRQTAALKGFQSLFADKTMDTRVQREWDRSRGQQLANTLSSQKAENILEMFPYQLDFAKGRIHQQETGIQKMFEEMEKIKTDTDFSKLKQDWYVTQLISRFGLDLAKTIGRVLPGGGIAGKFSKSIAPSKESFNRATRAFEQSTKSLYKGRFND